MYLPVQYLVLALATSSPLSSLVALLLGRESRVEVVLLLVLVTVYCSLLVERQGSS